MPLRTLNLDPQEWRDITNKYHELWKAYSKLHQENVQLREYYAAYQRETQRAELLARKIDQLNEILSHIQIKGSEASRR